MPGSNPFEYPFEWTMEFIGEEFEKFIEQNYHSEKLFFLELPREKRIDAFKIFFAEMVGKL